MSFRMLRLAALWGACGMRNGHTKALWKHSCMCFTTQISFLNWSKLLTEVFFFIKISFVIKDNESIGDPSELRKNARKINDGYLFTFLILVVLFRKQLSAQVRSLIKEATIASFCKPAKSDVVFPLWDINLSSSALLRPNFCFVVGRGTSFNSLLSKYLKLFLGKSLQYFKKTIRFVCPGFCCVDHRKEIHILQTAISPPAQNTLRGWQCPTVTCQAVSRVSHCEAVILCKQAEKQWCFLEYMYSVACVAGVKILFLVFLSGTFESISFTSQTVPVEAFREACEWGEGERWRFIFIFRTIIITDNVKMLQQSCWKLNLTQFCLKRAHHGLKSST